MPRGRKKDKTANWPEIQRRVCSGEDINLVANEHDVNHWTIRKRKQRDGWVVMTDPKTAPNASGQAETVASVVEAIEANKKAVTTEVVTRNKEIEKITRREKDILETAWERQEAIEKIMLKLYKKSANGEETPLTPLVCIRAEKLMGDTRKLLIQQNRVVYAVEFAKDNAQKLSEEVITQDDRMHPRLAKHLRLVSEASKS